MRSTFHFFAAMAVALIVIGVPSARADDTDDQIAKLKKEADLLTAQKAKLDAEKSVSDAQAQALIAKNIGTIAAGPFSGSVGLSDKAGSLEALLLASKAVGTCTKRLSDSVVARICPKAASGTGFDCKQLTVFLYKGSEAPSFQALAGYKFRLAYIDGLLTRANQAAAQKSSGMQTLEALVAPATVVGAGVTAFGNLLDFFKSDSTVAGVEAKLDDALLINSVAGTLSRDGITVRTPSLYAPPDDALTSDFAAKLTNLESNRSEAAKNLDKLNGLSAAAAKKVDAAKAKAAAAKKSADKKAAEDAQTDARAIVDKLKQPIADLTAAIAQYDAFLSYLTTANAQGEIPLGAIMQQAMLREALVTKGAKLLLVRLEATGGGSLVKKNLLTGLGAMPLFHMGGAAVSYVLLEGADGKVVFGDVIPIFGGYTRSDHLTEVLAE